MNPKSFFSFLNSRMLMGCVLSIFTIGFSQLTVAQTSPSLVIKPFAPAVLPGNGLSHFDFFYAGEGKQENMYIVRKGKIVWSYTHPASGEISDVMLLSNGNILFAHQRGITEITQNKKIVWNYDAPENTEIHTAQAIGKEHVLFLQNGNPAKLIVINKKSGKIVKELNIPVGNPNGIHGHFRNARLTAKGTILVAQMDMGKVCEYNANGKTLLTIDAPGVWAVEPLKNGNMLITTRSKVMELTAKAEPVWEYALQNIPDYVMDSPQKAIRLANGNTIINNWFNQWNGDGKVDNNNQPLQAIEVTADKKIVWALRTWNDPANLGPSTTIIPLNEPRTTEKVHFGDIK
jgi:hypothetical protein